MKKAKVMIGIEIDGQKLVLDEEAAKGLYDILHEMFGKKEVIREREIHTYPYYPYWSSTGTYIVDTTKRPSCGTPTIDGPVMPINGGTTSGSWTKMTTTGSNCIDLSYTLPMDKPGEIHVY